MAIALNGRILSAFGYVAPAEQSDTARVGIRILIGPIPALFFVAGVQVLSFYPINHDFRQRIAARSRICSGKPSLPSAAWRASVSRA